MNCEMQIESNEDRRKFCDQSCLIETCPDLSWSFLRCENKLFAVWDFDNYRFVFPKLQFDSDLKPLPGVATALRALMKEEQYAEDQSGWATVEWFLRYW